AASSEVPARSRTTAVAHRPRPAPITAPATATTTVRAVARPTEPGRARARAYSRATAATVMPMACARPSIARVVSWAPPSGAAILTPAITARVTTSQPRAVAATAERCRSRAYNVRLTWKIRARPTTPGAIRVSAVVIPAVS